MDTGIKVLELFAGSRSVGKVAESMGMDVFSVDVKAFQGIDLVQDIEFLTNNMIPFEPDVIWASPPCTTYSLAAISHHRNMIEPKTDFAAKSDRLVKNTLQIIKSYLSAKWFIENPRGMLAKMPFMQGLPKLQYGIAGMEILEQNQRIFGAIILGHYLILMDGNLNLNVLMAIKTATMKLHQEAQELALRYKRKL